MGFKGNTVDVQHMSTWAEEFKIYVLPESRRHRHSHNVRILGLIKKLLGKVLLGKVLDYGRVACSACPQQLALLQVRPRHSSTQTAGTASMILSGRSKTLHKPLCVALLEHSQQKIL